jgi:hypothetical protein
VGKPATTSEAAMIKAIKGMTADHLRARVLFCAEWYEPIQVMELKR